MMENMGYGQERLKDIVEKEAGEDIDLTPHQYGRTLMRAYRSFRVSHKLGRVPDHFSTQEVCNETVRINPLSLVYVHDHFKSKEMCDKVVEEGPWLLKHIPGQYKTQEMCDKVAGEDPGLLEHVPDCFKTQQMCNEAVEVDPSMAAERCPQSI